MKSILQFFKGDAKKIMAALVLGMLFTAGFTLYTKGYADTVQEGIAQEVVRFHVLANSDSAEDQALKLKVRDGVINSLKPGLSHSESLAESRAYIQNHLAEIRKTAEEIITENGYDYPVAVSLSRDYFPTKAYGDIALPAGQYEALRISIGEAQGKNWWCVMFPPLCYVDVTKKLPEASKEQLAKALTAEEYRLVSSPANEKDLPVKIKFKLVELWESRKAKEAPQELYANAKDRSAGQSVMQ